MATDLSITTERTRKFFDDLEAQRTILSSCTHLFTALTNHFTSLQDSLNQKSKSLNSKFQSLESNSQKALESLSQRESSIPERESAAAARIEKQKETALKEFGKSQKCEALSDLLKSFCRRMDSSGLLKFVVSKRKESVALRAEISGALLEAVDPAKLILDAVDEFVRDKSEKIGVTDKRWACGMLVQALFPDCGHFGGKEKGPEFARSMVEQAGQILEKWKKEKVEGEENGGGGGGGGGVVGPAEAVMFLQMVVGFGLKSRFDEEYLRKLVLEHAARRDMGKLAVAIGFGDKMGEIIDELVKNGKEIEAVYFTSESGLTERFPPVSLLKTYLKNYKKNTSTILRNGNNSAAATDEANSVELNSIKAIIKCVEDNKLESEFSLDILRKRATQLEKTKADRKKSSAAGKPQNKRGHSGRGGRSSGPPPHFRPAKAAKFSNAYSSFGRRNPGPPAQHSLPARYSGPYNYTTQSVYEGHTGTSYASAYGVSHTPSPAAIPQQHYPLPVDDVSAARVSGSSGGQTNYVSYDYGSVASSAFQPSS